MIDALFDFGPLLIPPLLLVLGYFGWVKRQKWARILLLLAVIVLIGAGVLLGLYVHALGQADWSL